MSNAEGSACSTPQRSASGEDSDSDYENENIRPRGLTGLQNLGNTCYLNSALQSLSNCPPLTRYFLDCPQLIRPEKSPMLSRSYLKLITELWHKKRPSYVVPSGVVSGIKAVHPMFRGYAQQDAQEFLRCLMDQLHEELKSPYSDDSGSEDEDDDGGGGDDDDGSNNANTTGDNVTERKVSQCEAGIRRPSFDSQSSQSELDYETCDSGLSSERSSNGGRDNGSSDENNSDSNDTSKVKRSERLKKSSATSSAVSDNTDSVANTKEMKETANLLEKKSESETQNRRPIRSRPVMEGGDFREQGSSTSYMAVPTKESEGQTTVTQPGTVTAVPVQTSQQQSMMPKAPVTKPAKARKAKNTRYDSIISQTFDGKILSSVRCLNCETVSTTKETFQDLSLPIPSKDHLHMLHSGYPAAGGVNPPKGGACGEVHQGWLAWMFSWMKSWFIGPTITLQDCLSAFFSADELKGDNMYSCEKCKKLRNGLKYSKVLELPEILSIHLKRFRHEFYSSKISTYISFPLEGLDMEPYLHKACKNEVTLYDLVAIICHHGTAGGGHYTAYCLNYLNEQWYEFDDQYVTEVDISQVQNCEAYVLFYRKSNRKMESVRQKVMELEQNETSILRFYLSKQWMSRFQNFAEPGPITNMDFLCKHGGVPPGKVALIDDLVEEIHQSTWELLYNRFGGGPVCNHLYACKTCHSELEKLRQRQFSEKESFIQLNEEFQAEEHSATVYAISMAWFKEWEAFVREKTDIPPGPIDNSRIIVFKNGQPTLKHTSDHGQLSKDMWLFLHRIYGGGPELLVRQSAGASVKPMSSSPTPAQNQAGGGGGGAGSLQAVASSSSLSSSPSQTSSTSSAVTSSSMPQSSSVPSSDTMASQTTSCTSPSSLTSPHSVSSSSMSSQSKVSSDMSESVTDNPPQPSSVSGYAPHPSPALTDKENEESASDQKSTGVSPEIAQEHPTEDVTICDQAPPTSLPLKDDSSDIPNNGVTSGGMEDNIQAPSAVKSTQKSSEVSSSAPGSPSQGNRVPHSKTDLPKTSSSAPATCLSVPQSKTKATLPQLSSPSIHTQGKPDEKASSQTQSSEAHIVNTSPVPKEYSETSAESLPDSGVGTDNSCSGNDHPSPPSSPAKQAQPESKRKSQDDNDKHNTNVPATTEEDKSTKSQSCSSTSASSSTGEPQDAATITQQQQQQQSELVEPKVTTAPAPPPSTNTGRGKKKNKKGKNMDVTRI